MAYENFKKEIWSAHIQTELGKNTVFKNDCDFEFNGEIKRGARVKILGVSKPTIQKYVPGKEIAAPEEPKDSSVYLEIDQFRYFNYGIDDVDAAQSSGVMSALSREATRALAEVEDSFCAEQIAKNAKHKFNDNSITTEAQAKELIDSMFVKLWNEGVSDKDKITIYLTPWFYNLFKNQIISLKTNNDSAISTGLIGSYNNSNVKMTNNIYNDGTYDHIIVKTSKGYAFANSINEVEAYRPEKQFSDAVKGLDCFGGKAVRPEQIATAMVKNS